MLAQIYPSKWGNLMQDSTGTLNEFHMPIYFRAILEDEWVFGVDNQRGSRGSNLEKIWGRTRLGGRPIPATCHKLCRVEERSNSSF